MRDVCALFALFETIAAATMPADASSGPLPESNCAVSSGAIEVSSRFLDEDPYLLQFSEIDGLRLKNEAHDITVSWNDLVGVQYRRVPVNADIFVLHVKFRINGEELREKGGYAWQECLNEVIGRFGGQTDFERR